MPIIDAHAHIYPEKIAARAVEAIGEFYTIEMTGGGGTAEDCLKVCGSTPITHFIVHSVATTAHSVPTINNFIAGECEKHPEFIGFATMHQDFENKEAEIDRAIELGLHGVKIHPDTQGVNIDDPRLMELYEIIEGRLPIVIHTGDYRYEFSRPERLLRVLKAFPNLVVDAAHYGGWSIYEIGYDVLHDAPNPERVFIDTSSSFQLMGTRRAEELIGLWGADRVMFGTDFPMWDQKTELDLMMSMRLSDDDKEKVLWRTAERFCGVKAS